ncbi:MAG TPA: DUF4388 domain-containing protein [Thermoanaerobaculia bacterium]|nr:DUF4388 domain-containing protein [Thermoanaerobaculia bacterium]
MEFSGRLAAFPMADLLQWARNEACTGALVIRRSQREKRVYFHSGDVVGCMSNDPAEFFGQYLLLHGHLNEGQLSEALSFCALQGSRLGVALREKGMLPPEVIQRALRSQIEEQICDLFLWQRGVFYFLAELPPEEEILPDPINVLGLVMEGGRWLDEAARIRRVLVHDDVVLRPGELAERKATERSLLERRILGVVDGERTLGDVYQRVKSSYFRFLEGAFKLCIDRALDVAEVRDSVESSTHELSVYDLLLEQATEEQVLVARRHMAVPLDLLERCYPVWVEEPATEERTRMPARARDFYSRLDGKTALGEAFSKDPRQRGREMDLLLLQLEKGRLAILPAPVDRLEARADERGQPALQRWWRRMFRAAS